MKLKTNIIFKGTLSEIVTDLETWKKQDPARAKAVMKAPGQLKITICNYPTKSTRCASVSAQRTIWPEEAEQIPKIIQEGLAE